MKHRPSYIPFDGDEFFKPLEGCEPSTVAAAIRLAWYYWSVTGCSGMRDDKEWLQRIARVSDKEWEAAEPVLFNEVFEQDHSGRWQHVRLKSLWDQSVERIRVASEMGKAAADARWTGKRRKR